MKWIHFLNINYAGIRDDVNKILKTKVEEKIRINRLDNDNRKRKFAEEGLAIHKANEVCAFCGNIISEESFSQLKSYFSADEVKELQNKIEAWITHIKTTREIISNTYIITNDFYPEFKSELNELKNELNNQVSIINKYFNDLLAGLEKKKGELFIESSVIDIIAPNGLNDIDAKYHELVKKE